MTGPADARPQRRRRRRRALAETAIMIVVAVLLAGLVRTFVFRTFWIPSASMVPTLGVHDRIMVQRAFFTWHDVREGDIVVFSHPPLAGVVARRPPRVPRYLNLVFKPGA